MRVLVTAISLTFAVLAAPPPDYASRPSFSDDFYGDAGWRSNERHQRWDNEWDYVVRAVIQLFVSNGALFFW